MLWPILGQNNFSKKQYFIVLEPTPFIKRILIILKAIKSLKEKCCGTNKIILIQGDFFLPDMMAVQTQIIIFFKLCYYIHYIYLQFTIIIIH